jgi:molybdopterin-guanine dinucleotide biosynthesis protein B
MLNQAPVLQVVGYKNSGKTTLITTFITYLSSTYQLKIASLKHDHHGFSLDVEGKDTWKHRQAGAVVSLIQSQVGLGLTMGQDRERSLCELVDFVHTLGSYDMIIVEGFKREAYPKIVLIRHKDDISLIQELTQIQILIFTRGDALHLYEKGMEKGILPQYPYFQLDEEGKIIKWVDAYWLQLASEKGEEE